MDTKRNVKIIVSAVIIILAVTFCCGLLSGQNLMYQLPVGP